MATEIFYFSGTGNSQYAAKLLSKHLPNAILVPILERIKNEDYIIDGDLIGFVFPLHGMTLPVPVRLFLQRANFTKSPYIFGVTTRAGSKVYAFDSMARLLKRKGQHLNASCILTMWNNDPKLKEYEQPTAADIEAMRASLPAQINAFAQTINAQDNSLAIDTDFVTFDLPQPLAWLMEQLILFAMWLISRQKVKHYFAADKKCIGCGVCENVCLANKIKLVDAKPVWDDSLQCYYCYTCLNYCPTQAIQINDKPYMKSYTPEKGRYPHPFANAKEIAEQK